MSLPRIALIGTCVTRDAWMLPELAPSGPVCMVARTSLASLSLPEGAANPLASLVAGLPASPTFEARCLRTDLAKSAFSQISEHRPDVLMLDLIDERFDLIAIGDAVFCESLQWITDMPGLGLPSDAGRRIPRLSDEAWRFWCEGLERLHHAVQTGALGASRLILHKCLWADEIIGDGRREPLPDMSEILSGRFTSRALHRDLLCRMYDAVIERFPEAEVIDPPAHLRIADAAHRWGPAPFHFIPDYYRAVASAAEALGVPLATRQAARA